MWTHPTSQNAANAKKVSAHNGVPSLLTKYMREHKLAGVPHGFRSTLRTWLTDHTDISYEIAEIIIPHQVGSQVERAYNWTDYLERRRHYMELWSVFITSEVQV